MTYPYYRVTAYYKFRGKSAPPSPDRVDKIVQRWFDYLLGLGDKVALVFCPELGWSVWRIGQEQGNGANSEEISGEVRKVSSNALLWKGGE